MLSRIAVITVKKSIYFLVSGRGCGHSQSKNLLIAMAQTNTIFFMALVSWGLLSPTDAVLSTVLDAGFSHACALEDDATAVCFGSIAGVPATQLPASTLYLDISAGGAHSCAIRAAVCRCTLCVTVQSVRAIQCHCTPRS